MQSKNNKYFVNMNTLSITNDTPVALMTAGQLRDFLRADSAATPKPVEQPTTKNYVYGLRGIQKLYNCSQPTAQRLKNGIIKEAVSQHGRKIVVDADLAMQLFKNSKSGMDK